MASTRLFTFVLVCVIFNDTFAGIVIPSMYQEVAYRHKIPAHYVYCIALQESRKMTHGRTLPWPWTLNIAGTGHFYPTRKQASIALNEALRYTRLIDVGLMQINVKYHGHRFSHIDEMLEPMHNIQMGAKILKENYQRFKSWKIAIGKYHSYGNNSKQKQRALRYYQQVKKRCIAYD